MRNFQTKLDVIGNNIANVNTYGFKKGRVTFKDMMSQTVQGASAATENRGGTNPKQVGLGSTLATIDTIHEGSSLQTTNRSLDLGIDGDGYFVVRQGQSLFYTRAGNFYLDENGLLVNGDGLPVQAFRVNELGMPTNEYGDVSVNVNAVLPAQPTTYLAVEGNLAAKGISEETGTDADGNLIVTVEGTVYTQQVRVVDRTGTARILDLHFKKTADNEWQLFINREPELGNPIFATVTFGADGTVNSVNTAAGPVPETDGRYTFNIENLIPVGEGEFLELEDSQLVLNLSMLTQLEGPSTAIPDADGNLEGRLESFNFGPAGEINGVYSNGEIVTLGFIALAKFSNSSGLMKAGSNLFQETVNSGVANIGVPGDGRGTLVSGSLEMSNVDLSEEFTEMIVAQRGFQANTRIITTSDEILQELVNLKR